jgi:hypothetical protein
MEAVATSAVGKGSGSDSASRSRRRTVTQPSEFNGVSEIPYLHILYRDVVSFLKKNPSPVSASLKGVTCASQHYAVAQDYNGLVDVSF